MSSVNFAIPDFCLDFCLLIPNVPALAGNFLPKLHWKGLKFEFCWEDFSDRNVRAQKSAGWVACACYLTIFWSIALLGVSMACFQNLYSVCNE